jgi:hypothetical protein
VTFDPPLSIPCKYDQHANQYIAFTIRARSTGMLQFTASAAGEVIGEDCHCWCYTSGQDNGPAIFQAEQQYEAHHITGFPIVMTGLGRSVFF